MLMNIVKKILFLSVLLLTACDPLTNLTNSKPIANQPAVLSKDMYLCETYASDSAKDEKYFTYPGFYFRYSKTLLPSIDEYLANRVHWQNWIVLPNSKSRIVALLPKGTLIKIKNFKVTSQYDQLLGDETTGEVVILSGPYQGKTVVVNTTFLQPAKTLF